MAYRFLAVVFLASAVWAVDFPDSDKLAISRVQVALLKAEAEYFAYRSSEEISNARLTALEKARNEQAGKYQQIVKETADRLKWGEGCAPDINLEVVCNKPQ
jgi:hypothetical protein